MKAKLFSALLLILCFSLFGKPVDENRAKAVGLYFLKNKVNSQILKDASDLRLSYKTTAKFSSGLDKESVLFYVFNIETTGYIIVAGDDAVTPILGYSDQGNFVSGDMPSNIQKWLEGYKNQINFIVSNDIKATDEINREWSLQNANRNDNASSLTANAVNPLIQTRWNQSPNFNAMCPGGSVTGCVATAMAQVMKFWNYPSTGSGFHSYNHPQYGTLSANFGNTTYQWNSMNINSPTTLNEQNAVATLMYHCGVSVNMIYNLASQGGSSAQTLDVENALKTYFGYSTTAVGKFRTNYTDSQWINLLKTELDAGRPIQYAGTGTGGGHSFVCDGYDVNSLLHFNWGWGGSSDGYFQMNALNPGSLGAGGGAGCFNSNQRAIIGIQPPTASQTYDMALYNNLVPSAATVGYGNAFTVSTNITNNGTNTFTGDYTIAVFDNDGNFIDYVETKINQTLPGLNHYVSNLVFSTTGLFGMVPGTYNLGLYYKTTGGNWKIVKNSGSGYVNLASVTIVNNNAIALNSAMAVSPSTTLVKGQPASVNLNIKNNGSTTFLGQYQVNLYNLDGSFVQTISAMSENNGLPAGYTYSSPFLTFSTLAVTANPGTYIMALQHKSVTGSWQLTGSSFFQNPIKVTVIEAPYSADVYENNDTFNQSYSLPLSFSNNAANANTVGSNCHVGTDNDYYKMILPSGYNYTVSPRLHDNFNSGNGIIYSLDALFSYSTDGVNWSNAYDDVLGNNITVNNGGTVYFHVAPYYQGQKGTYLLDVNLSRTTSLGVVDNELSRLIKFYPNPTSSKIFFDNSNSNFENVLIYNYLGQEVSKVNFSSSINNQEVDLSGFSNGVYILKLWKQEESKTVKIIKQ
jgi:hypothetical protein